MSMLRPTEPVQHIPAKGVDPKMILRNRNLERSCSCNRMMVTRPGSYQSDVYSMGQIVSRDMERDNKDDPGATRPSMSCVHFVREYLYLIRITVGGHVFNSE